MGGTLAKTTKHVIVDKDGYILSYRPNHPFCNGIGYVREHRLVYEHYLFILFDEPVYIPRNIDIDHENMNVQDNSLINLRPLTRSQHITIHNMGNKYNQGNKEDMSNRFCYLCNGKTHFEKNGIEHWYKYQKELICNLCYNKIQYKKKKVDAS